MSRLPMHAFVLLGLGSLASCGGCNGNTPAPPAGAPVASTSTPPSATGRNAEGPTAQAGSADCFVIVDAEPDFGAPPLTVHFSTETDCTGSPVAFSWDFGDGTKGGNDAKPAHTYEKAGDYVATVTTSAPDGGTGSDEIDITVDEDLSE
jgi:PKD repeat protein